MQVLGAQAVGEGTLNGRIALADLLTPAQLAAGGGSITITGADTGLLVYRETVTGSGGSITRQASMVIMLNILAASVGGVALTQDGHLLSIAAT